MESEIALIDSDFEEVEYVLPLVADEQSGLGRERVWFGQTEPLTGNQEG